MPKPVSFLAIMLSFDELNMLLTWNYFPGEAGLTADINSNSSSGVINLSGLNHNSSRMEAEDPATSPQPPQAAAEATAAAADFATPDNSRQQRGSRSTTPHQAAAAAAYSRRSKRTYDESCTSSLSRHKNFALGERNILPGFGHD